ncbi:MAG TPA: PHB accumulation regulatory domain-containing protein, partial [Xanthomonadales bacterium]|nr:PHB accumulation regulatory domain-containing protein [Xanthomonadales bacterium]
GDSLQGFMSGYLERSLQTFLEQSQQFRTQLNSMIGQTPWNMLNDMTERNLDIWKTMQNRFLTAAGAAAKTPPGTPPQAGPEKGDKRR